MALDLYRDVVERVRARNPQLIINLTTGPGGRYVPSEDDPPWPAPAPPLCGRKQRVEHIAALRPDICTLDLNTMNSGGQVVINTPANVRRMARIIRDAGAKPEIELFDSGDIALLHDLVADGTLDPAPLCSFVMGVRYGFQPAPETVLYARKLLPAGAAFTAIGIGRHVFTIWRRVFSPAAMSASASRTVSISRAACSRQATRRWSPRRATSSRNSAAETRHASPRPRSARPAARAVA